jgi:dephospho-CoA kinase
MLHVGLTGGIASGKSTVATILTELGAHLIDADRIARDVVAVGTPGLAAVRDAFGSEVLDPYGALDRRALAQLVFDDAPALAVLNGIVHPRVREESAARVSQLPDDAVVVHDVPLIVENGMGAQFHLVVVVGASMAVRIERAVARGLTEAEATARVAAQADDRARRLAADVWVDNESSEESLRGVVELLWRARIVPFADNLAAGRWAEPGEISTPPEPREWQEQAVRLAARIERAAGDRVESVRQVPPTDQPTLDVIELRALPPAADLPADALIGAGFVKVRDLQFANADPGRPAVLTLDDDAA